MRVVVFTSQIAGRTGGEINLRDWALGLKSRGHDVVGYAPVLGALAEVIRAANVAIVDDPSLITDVPDIVFGCGINEVAALAARFPDVPVVQVSQQWDDWASFPSPLPQVMFHVAVDDLNANSVANEFGVPRERIRIVHNAVDLARLRAREGTLPARPQRALILVKRDTSYVQAVREACEKRDIVADLLGPGVGVVIDDLLAAMSESDLVVGSARTAIEAAAAGAAVVVADHRGLAGLLTTGNFPTMRANNFGRAVLTRPLAAEAIGSEIDRYDPAEAAAVTRLVHEVASLDRQLEQLEGIFVEAIASFKRAGLSSGASSKALSSYLARHLPRHGEPSPRHAFQPESLAESNAPILNDRLRAITNRLGALELELMWGSRGELSASAEVDLAGRNAQNLIARSEQLDQLFPVCSIAALDRLKSTIDGASVYVLTAVGGESEHYIQHTIRAAGGAMAFSLEARDAGAPKLRIQLLDEFQNGVYADFDFRDQGFALGRFARASRMNGGFHHVGDGWFKLWITGTLPDHEGGVTVIVQIGNQDGQLSFLPAGESLCVRCVQLEQGRWPSAYHST